VGVARQYCGQVGKQENCQTAVSLSIATHQASLPVAYRLYLPKEWADDAARRSKAGVPEDVTFHTKPEIALQQMRHALADGVPPAVALADPAYGNNRGFALGSLNSGWLTRSVSCPPRRSGGPARHPPDQVPYALK
jgi:SRSO17 transposase